MKETCDSAPTKKSEHGYVKVRKDSRSHNLARSSDTQLSPCAMHLVQCPTPTSTAGKGRSEGSTAPSGALSKSQITARVQAGKWWPFDRVDAKLLEKIHRQKIKQPQPEEEIALL